MKQLLISILVLSSLNSCVIEGALFGQITGNRHVTTETRTIHDDFSHVKGSQGLDIYLEKGNENSVRVEADENLHQYIDVFVEDQTLRIKVVRHKNIGRAKSKKIYVTYTDINAISASSGADIIVNSILKSEYITLKSSSGADLDVEVNAKKTIANCSSGADIKLSGKSRNFEAKASSGSDISAKNLLTKNSYAKASSGADISLRVTHNLEVRTSSGGNVNYYGNPENVSKNKSLSGSVRKM